MTADALIELLARVDLGWKNREPIPLSPWIHSLQRNHELNALTELLATDSEWRWRMQKYRSVEEDSSGRSLAEDTWTPRSVERYLDDFPEFRSQVTSVLIMVEAEFLSRSLWGNPPTIAEFLSRFPQIDGLDAHLAEVLDEHVPLKVTVDRPPITSTRQPDFIVKTPLVLGRRSRKEFHAGILSDDERRLIVADNDANDVSRQHARITRTAVHQVLIENLSSQGRLQINGIGVRPSSVTPAQLPVNLAIAQKSVLIDTW